MRTNLVGPIVFALALASALPAVCAPPAADSKFIKDVAADGKAEVQLGQLAAEKASRDGVKDFGKMMVEDHTKAGAELAALASQKGIAIPTGVKPQHKALHDRLSKLSGAAFDTAYMDAMVKDHEKAVAAFKKEAASGGDPDVKAWAAKTLPTLETHLTKARELAGKPMATHQH
jgi:putative membrane protein